MSIKYRIPLLLAVTMLIFAGCMYLFFLFYQNSIQQMMERFTVTAEDVSARIAQSGGPGGLSLEAAMATAEWPDQIGVLVATEENEVVFFHHAATLSSINVQYVRQVADAAGVGHRVTVEQNVDMDRVDVRQEIARVSVFASALVLLTLVFVLLYLHVFVSRPLMALWARMNALHGRSAGTGKVDRHLEARGGVWDRRGDEIVQLDQGFERMREALEAGRKSRDEMVASISHDLRNPLTSIMGYTERLMDMEESFPDPRTGRYLHVIREKAEDIAAMLEEFHAYMEGETGVLHLQDVDLTAFLASVAEEYSEELAGMGHPFSWTSRLPESMRANMDLAKMRRVFSNLVANAVRHGGPGVGIRMAFSMEADHAVCVVADDGPGVPSEELDRIFEFMFRSGTDRNRGRDKAGSGLGLTICKQIVTLHGGTITAFLPVEGGFAVRFTIRTQQGGAVHAHA